MRREDLRLLRRDRRVPRDKHRHDLTCRLNSKRQQRNIKKQNVLRKLRINAFDLMIAV
jgi:hypothetical protein